MYMQHLFRGRIQIVSLYIICLDSDVPCRTMGSFTSTVLILQAFLVPCDRGVSESQPVFVYPHILGCRAGSWYLLRPPQPLQVSKSLPELCLPGGCNVSLRSSDSCFHQPRSVDMTRSWWSRADRLSHVPAVTEWVFLWGRWKEGGFFVLSASGRSIEVVKNIGSVGCEGGEWRVCSTVISPRAEISEQYLTGL